MALATARTFVWTDGSILAAPVPDDANGVVGGTSTSNGSDVRAPFSLIVAC